MNNKDESKKKFYEELAKNQRMIEIEEIAKNKLEGNAFISEGDNNGLS